MKRLLILTLGLILVAEVPAHAIIVDTFVSGLQYAQDQAYQAFMKLKVIEELEVLKQNYDASVRYYDEFKQLNSGKGILYNLGSELESASQRMGDELKTSIDRDFVHTYKTDTQVDLFFQSIDRGIATNMKYAGDELGNLIANRKTAVSIATNADGLSPKDAANMAVKAQSMQLQMLVQLHEDNLRMMQIQSMQLANAARRQEAEQALIGSIRQSVSRIAPDAVKGDAQ